VRKKLGVGFRVLLALATWVLAVVQSLIVTGRVHWSPWAAVAAAGGLGLLGFQLFAAHGPRVSHSHSRTARKWFGEAQ
jgi:hypothetical protein